MLNSETIFALSTPFGKSGVAIIRISGKDSLFALRKLGVKEQLTPRVTYVTDVYSYPEKELLDNAIVLYHQSPNSFTGEDVVEIHCHGSIAVIKDLLQSLSNIENLRHATAGEFAKRAFYNNKLDLTKAEGLVSLIDSETAMQRRIALKKAKGEQESLYENWRKQMVELLAYIEALIDFPDEDIPKNLQVEIDSKISNLIQNITNHIKLGEKGKSLMTGIKVAIIGVPNAGKSSLINYLSNEDIAIVNAQAGTTRDVLQTKVDLKGYPVIFYDTAGIRETTDEIESEGVAKALKKANEADIIIHLIDATVNEDEQTIEYLSNVLKVYNKVDIAPVSNAEGLKISIKNKVGLTELMDELFNIIVNKFSVQEGEVIANQRQQDLLQESVTHLNNIGEESLDITAENIRLAANTLGYITGKIDVEEVLDQVFSTFCIGK